MKMKLHNRMGFTLLEVMIAMFLFSYGVLALFSLLTSVIKGTDMAKRQTQAMNLGTEKMEALKSIPYANIQSSGSASDPGKIDRACTGASPTFTCTPSPAFEMIDSMRYTWKWKVTLIDVDGDDRLIEESGVPDNGDAKKIEVSVEWTDMFGPHKTTLVALRKI